MADGWTWEFRGQAVNDFKQLDVHAQDRISTKLTEIVNDEWREPDDYLEPLTGVGHWKLRIGAYRLGCELDRDARLLLVRKIEHRSGAYQPGDD